MDRLISIQDLAIVIDLSYMGIYKIINDPKTKLEKSQLLRARKHSTLIHENIEYIKIGYNYYVDLNKFVNSHKIYDFKDRNYLEMIEVKMTVQEYFDSLPEYITASILIEDFFKSSKHIHDLRESGKVRFKIHPNNKRKFKYTYNKNDFIDNTTRQYIESGMVLTIKKPQKLFYKISDVLKILKEKYGISTTVQTINRRILNKKSIPAIRIRQQLRIPIVLFDELTANEIQNIFKDKRKKK